MTSDINRSVAATYQLKIEAHRISKLMKYKQLLGLKSLGFCQKVMFALEWNQYYVIECSQGYLKC